MSKAKTVLKGFGILLLILAGYFYCFCWFI